ncbi:hypothetical protein [Virgibacillus salexigens]|uniref:hypothetical protein n=1 Tax=Virgibacillus massiliensis TaxID=1462526 RepID=UPI00136ED99B|nr:hypothetical protein [Virgibacillus massiliensis]MYL43947.1 hypothetical protein [Virgibacillus massiliensis]
MKNLFEDTNNRIKVKSKLLNLLLEGGKYSEKISIAGYTTNGCMGFARFALERLIRYAFNIHRFPGYEDRTVFREAGGDSFRYFWQWTDFFENIVSEEEINEAIEEIINIYNHVQEQLQGETTITCYRGLQPFEYMQFIKELETVNNSNNILSYRANTIISFREDRDGYYDRLTLKAEIPVENIFMHHSFIETYESKSSFAKKNGLMYENEILYLNDDLKGMFLFHREDILNWERVKEDHHFQRIINDSEEKAFTYGARHQLYNQTTYHQIFLYDQVYWIYLKDYKNHVLANLPWWMRRKARKELELF